MANIEGLQQDGPLLEVNDGVLADELLHIKTEHEDYETGEVDEDNIIESDSNYNVESDNDLEIGQDIAGTSENKKIDQNVCEPTKKLNYEW